MKRVGLAALVAAIALAATAASSSAATLSGSCTINGVANFGLPLKVVAQPMNWSFTSTPGQSTCTGLVNGNFYNSTPANVTVNGFGPISCGILGYTLGAQLSASFPDVAGNQTLNGTLSLVSPAAQNVLLITGSHAGTATGRASFFLQNDPVATTEGCVNGNSVTSLNVTVTIATPFING